MAHKHKNVSLILQDLAAQIDATLAQAAGEKVAFVMVLQADSVVQYVANTSRDDGVALLASLLDRWQAKRADIPAHYNPDLKPTP